eukprot:TRINITY_DN67688_c0_g1_i1.p1 TRINITY_DN67688_c0_g1~~TRINITY_DN67688_c0_g1_i1.p1  ORF type:complete len:507 (+),score=92.97 TRINITY_DN67688_c0_g1_i1:52-1521(+)
MASHPLAELQAIFPKRATSAIKVALEAAGGDVQLAVVHLLDGHTLNEDIQVIKVTPAKRVCDEGFNNDGLSVGSASAPTPQRRRSERKAMNACADDDDVEVVGEKHCSSAARKMDEVEIVCTSQVRPAMFESDEALAQSLALQDRRRVARLQAREARDAAIAREMARLWDRDSDFVHIQSSSDSDLAKIVQAETGGIQASCRCCASLCVAASSSRAAVCQKHDCIERDRQLCERVLSCGHPCLGIKGEASCDVPCILCSGEQTCGVCLDSLAESPSIKLACGHLMHMGCAISMVENADWRGRKITPASLRCPSGCGKLLDHSGLESRMQPFRTKLAQLEAKVVVRAKGDGVTHQKPEELLRKYTYYECFRCQAPYFGGLAECEAVGMEMEEPKPESVLCPCCMVAGQATCNKHGAEFMSVKCDFCCSEALFKCGGNIMYCQACHTPPTGKVKPCDPSTCPLRGQHPQGRTHQWMMGCAACRADADNAAT